MDLVDKNIEKYVQNLSDSESDLLSEITEYTKVIFLSHITSMTAMRFPVKEVIEFSKINGILLQLPQELILWKNYITCYVKNLIKIILY